MEPKQVHALCYSATGTTERLVRALAQTLEQQLNLPQTIFHGFRRPIERAADYVFGPGDLVVAGTPVYAGRMPNKLLPDFQTRLHGNGAAAIALVTYGGRAYDNALAELVSVLEADGFHTAAAGAFVCRHAFTDALQAGRPDGEDLRELEKFGRAAAEKLRGLTEPPPPIQVPGDPAGPYYVPKGLDGQAVNFLRARPKTDLARCSCCGACARRCPMGAIDPEDPARVPGTCIKCQACVRGCTRHAKYFDDTAFLSHVAMLEANFQGRKRNEVFL